MTVKKRTIILIHLLYWFYIIGQFLFPVYAGQHKRSRHGGSSISEGGDDRTFPECADFLFRVFHILTDHDFQKHQ